MSWQIAESPECSGTDGESVDLVITPKVKSLGSFDVRRALPSSERQMIGPFIFFDQMGPAVLEAGQAMDVRPHPHIGISTITWLFDGEIRHQDSLGFDMIIRPGEVNWMTAGSGIVHSERSPENARDIDAPLAGIQAWIALPKEHEETAPAFYHYPADQIPRFSEDGVSIALIAGKAWGQQSPVTVFTETLYAEINLDKDKLLSIPDETEERGIYVYSGKLLISGQVTESGTMVVLRPGVKVVVEAQEDTCFMLLGGAKMDGPRHLYWNFVSSSRERIEQAKQDWLNNRFEKVHGDDEFIPLPDQS